MKQDALELLEDMDDKKRQKKLSSMELEQVRKLAEMAEGRQERKIRQDHAKGLAKEDMRHALQDEESWKKKPEETREHFRALEEDIDDDAFWKGLLDKDEQRDEILDNLLNDNPVGAAMYARSTPNSDHRKKMHEEVVKRIEEDDYSEAFALASTIGYSEASPEVAFNKLLRQADGSTEEEIEELKETYTTSNKGVETALKDKVKRTKRQSGEWDEDGDYAEMLFAEHVDENSRAEEKTEATAARYMKSRLDNTEEVDRDELRDLRETAEDLGIDERYPIGRDLENMAAEYASEQYENGDMDAGELEEVMDEHGLEIDDLSQEAALDYSLEA